MVTSLETEAKNALSRINSMGIPNGAEKTHAMKAASPTPSAERSPEVSALLELRPKLKVICGKLKTPIQPEALVPNKSI